MGHKNLYPSTANWQASAPFPFTSNPNVNSGGSTPSGTVNGAMASTNTIYSQIFEKSRMDNIGCEVAWTGTPTGVLSVMVSNSGKNFNALTFNPVIGQPAGSAAGEAIDLNQVPFKFIMFKYVNTSGTGTLNIYLQFGDVN